jgi:negative regulator of sigma-B (phosphoserine phosphatase)
MEALRITGIPWAVASAPHPGETVLGDAFLVKEIRGGTLLAVVDGLGHGPEAAAAAAIGIATLEANADAPVSAMLDACHEKLRGTRGATVSVAVLDFERDAMRWSGVGDVAVVLLRSGFPSRARSLVRSRGVLGSGSPTWLVTTEPLQRGDLVVLSSDGIRPGFEPAIRCEARAHDIAETVLAGHRKGSDDALVLVARYGGAMR